MTENKLDFLSSERIFCPKYRHSITLNVYLKGTSMYFSRPKVYVEVALNKEKKE